MKDSVSRGKSSSQKGRNRLEPCLCDYPSLNISVIRSPRIFSGLLNLPTFECYATPDCAPKACDYSHATLSLLHHLPAPSWNFRWPTFPKFQMTILSQIQMTIFSRNSDDYLFLKFRWLFFPKIQMTSRPHSAGFYHMPKFPKLALMRTLPGDLPPTSHPTHEAVNPGPKNPKHWQTFKNKKDKK